jgi:regulator-associated protein of mTOR
VSKNTIHAAMWKHILILSVDPHPEIASHACVIVDHVIQVLLQSPLSRVAQSTMDQISRLTVRRSSVKPPPALESPTRPVSTPTQTPPAQVGDKSDGSLLSSIKRTASVAASLKLLAFSGTASADSSPKSTVTRGATPAGAQAIRLNGPPRSQLPVEWSRPPDQNDPHPVQQPQVPAKVPLPREYKPSGLQTPVLPLTSTFLEWSVEYFQEPQMKQSDADEPGSTDYNERLWRTTRNEKIIALTQPLKAVAGSSPWDTSATHFDNTTQPMRMSFHQFEDHLAIADDRDLIS